MAEEVKLLRKAWYIGAALLGAAVSGYWAYMFWPAGLVSVPLWEVITSLRTVAHVAIACFLWFLAVAFLGVAWGAWEDIL